MAVIALGSAAGSPGVTTSALGLALTWPRPVLLIEADPTGGSAMLAGFFRGTTAQTAGLIDLAWAQREGLLTTPSLSCRCRFLTRRRHCCLGSAPTPSGQPGRVVGAAGGRVERAGRHGSGCDHRCCRLGLVGSPEPLIYAADLMLLVMRSDLVALAAARSWAETLRAGFDELGARARVRPLVGEGRPYRGRDVAKVLGLPVVAALAWQEAEAAVFSRGAARRAASMAGLCRGACGPPGQRSIGDRGRCGPARLPRGRGGLDGRTGIPRQRRPRRPAALRTRPGFSPGSGPFDLLDASRPGRHPRRCGDRQRRRRPPCWSESAARVGSAHRAGRPAGAGWAWTGRWWRGCEPRHRNG